MEQFFQGFAGVPHINNQIVSYLSGREILGLREVNKAFKTFVDSNLKYFYKKKRERNIFFPDVIFTSLLDINIKLFINSNKLFVRKILKDKDLSNYHISEISKILDDSTVFEFISYLQMGLAFFQSRRLMYFFTKEEVKKFLYLYEKNITSTYYCENVSKNLNNSQIRVFIELKKKDISDYYSFELSKECPISRINYYIDLVSRGVSEYYAFLVIREFSDEKIAQFSVLHSHYKLNIYYNFLVCKTLTTKKIISFLASYKKSKHLFISYNEVI